MFPKLSCFLKLKFIHTAMRMINSRYEEERKKSRLRAENREKLRERENQFRISITIRKDVIQVGRTF